MLQTRYGSLGILGHNLRNKIPIVGNQGKVRWAAWWGGSKLWITSLNSHFPHLKPQYEMLEAGLKSKSVD
jgi:hypothetical protein